MGHSSENRPWIGKNCLFILIVSNIIMFIFSNIVPQIVVNELALSSGGLLQFKIWQFITYMFIHAGPMHLIFNMWGLFLFGSVILPLLGTTRLLTLYFLSGISGAGLWLLINWGPGPHLVGASGAVFGIMMGAAMLCPNMRLQLLFPPIVLKMKTLVAVFAVIEVVSEISNPQSGIAHLAHLGGLVCAYVYIKSVYGDQAWDMFAAFRLKKRETSPPSKLPKGWKIYSNPSSKPPVSEEEVNRILDKISAHGMQSLTDDEMNVLRKASEEMKKRNT